MKYYKDINNEVFAYEEDGSQDHLIGDKVAMTKEEVQLHLNPPKTEAQKKAEVLAQISELEASQARPLRELLMDNTNKIARQKLADIDAKITELRKQL